MPIRKPDNCSASSASRWLACPGSVALSATLPKPVSTFWAQEGTEAHAVIESLVPVWQSYGCQLAADRVSHMREFYVGLSPHKSEMFDHAIGYLGRFSKEIGAFDQKPTIRSEMKIAISEERGMFGRIDLGAVGLRDGVMTAVISDYKYGKGVPVSAVGNSQTAYYATAVWKSSPRGIKRVKTMIVQPRHEAGYSEAWLDEECLSGWYTKFITGADKAKEQFNTGHVELHAGDHCRFCPAIRICPEKKKPKVGGTTMLIEPGVKPLGFLAEQKLKQPAKQGSLFTDAVQHHG